MRHAGEAEYTAPSNSVVCAWGQGPLAFNQYDRCKGKMIHILAFPVMYGLAILNWMAAIGDLVTV